MNAPRKFNPNSEVELAGRAAARGAHAAGVPFSAARRKPRTTYFFVRRRKLERGHEGLGGPPNPARGPRALPISNSEFGFKAPFHPKERIWQEADRWRAAHPAVGPLRIGWGEGGRRPGEVSFSAVKVLDLAEFGLQLDLVPVEPLREAFQNAVQTRKPRVTQIGWLLTKPRSIT